MRESSVKVGASESEIGEATVPKVLYLLDIFLFIFFFFKPQSQQKGLESARPKLG